MAILSIQSHVVYGYAGNTASVFPLQRLGNEVWAINTVEFSNHTGYGSWKGKVLGADLVSDLVSGLEERGVLNRCDAVLSGYLGDAQTARAIIDTVKKVRKYSPNAVYCCDPVMGDTDRGIYVKPDIPDMFKRDLVPLADIVCPNQFELEVLTGVTVNNLSDVLKAIGILHEMGPKIVLVTSYKEKQGELGMIASMRHSHSFNCENPAENILYKITTPELPLPGSVAGTGDMTTSIFLSHFLKSKNLGETLSCCTSSVYGILEESYKKAREGLCEQSSMEEKPIELDFIRSQEQLINPIHSFNAEKLFV
ncbi:MAG: pyridoxal kinase PdxY [Treponema sp.]|nr:pyridoxal kinase PdxY [Treponema sp.]